MESLSNQFACQRSWKADPSDESSGSFALSVCLSFTKALLYYPARSPYLVLCYKLTLPDIILFGEQSHFSPGHSWCAPHVEFLSVLCDEKFLSHFLQDGLPLLCSYLLLLSQACVIDCASLKFIGFSEIKSKYTHLIFLLLLLTVCVQMEQRPSNYTPDSQPPGNLYGFETSLGLSPFPNGIFFKVVFVRFSLGIKCSLSFYKVLS